jgi:hypothetical protein
MMTHSLEQKARQSSLEKEELRLKLEFKRKIVERI